MNMNTQSRSPPVGNTPRQMPQQQFNAVELPVPWQGGDNPNAPPNTQQRYEMPSQTLPRPTPPWTQFSISTNDDSLSSGFPYSQRLLHLGIPPDRWQSFTHQLTAAAKLTSREDLAAWTAGVGSGAVSSPFLLIFAPVVGYYTGRSVHRKTVVKKVKAKLANQEGNLLSVLKTWNEGLFRERGMEVWLETPTDEGNILVDIPFGTDPRDVGRLAKKQAKRFRIVVMPVQVANRDSVVSDVSAVSPVGEEGKWNYQPSSVAPTWTGNKNQPVYQSSVEGNRVSELPAGIPGEQVMVQIPVELDGGNTNLRAQQHCAGAEEKFGCS